VELKNLPRKLGGPRIFIKRDDLTGLALGGNKSRKLEFLLGEALSQNCDVVVTGGAMQSNTCRQTAAAATAAGMECHLALGGEAPEFATGNLLFDYLCGAHIHWCGANNKGEQIPEIAADLQSQGHKPYIMPFGGSNAIGALGLVEAMRELRDQMQTQNIRIDTIILPSSSGGTQAGMEVGSDLYGLAAEIIGIGIDRKEPGEPAYESELAALADQIAEKLGTKSRYVASRFQMRYDYADPGYEVVTDLEREAIRLVAQSEGILLDPVYTARAMGGLIDMIRKKEFNSEETVLFWHTGGMPALFEHSRELGR
jgi:D-cysteine desulfhydrase